MKTIKQTLLYCWFILAFLFVYPEVSYAQDKDMDWARIDSSGAHWEVRTDAQTLTTTIKFFDEDDNLIYREILKGRYIKLNTRNTRLLDSTLHKLIRNKLLGEQLHGYILSDQLTSARHKPSERLKTLSQQKTDTLQGSQQIECLLASNKKLYIQIRNPASKRIYMRLMNDKEEYFFEKSLFDTTYNQKLDISALPAGEYSLLIHAKQKSIVYQLSIRSISHQTMDYQLQTDIANIKDR
ncbi:hypothetical protein [Xanthocytophaga agilis]|uniref:Uncharacterized protein n=1 Tax=Xanthocytophaga agilis TaxID=3048010 RepID=A0AAE3UFX7_9BACT|nr:hypothetical protein [Xanthocytophaga agilis]MDJ1503775.1 hypothetical protein [Xanthocytophaga agilis]